jgi:hypothetical protein
MQVCGKTLQKCIFSVWQSARQSHSGSSSCASNAHDDREKESENFKREDAFFTHTKGGSFLILVQKSSFRRCWGLSFFSTAARRKKKFVRERERRGSRKKREIFKFLVETSYTYTKITHHHHTSQQEFFLLCDSTTPFLRRSFSFQRYSDKRNNVVVSFLCLLFETRFTRVRSSIVNTISIFIQRTTSGERFFL